MSSLVLVVAFCMVVFILLMKSSSSPKPSASTADRPTAVKKKADPVVPAAPAAPAPVDNTKPYRDPGTAPTSPGCHIAMPTGCPNQTWNGPAHSQTWFDPTAGGSPESCKIRQQACNDACGRTDALMVYNDPPAPPPVPPPPPLPQFDQSSPGDGHLYTIRGHHAHHHAGKYLSMTTHESYGSIPKYTVFLSDTQVNHSTATSQWHFKWHKGKVRMVGRGTPHAGHNEGVALYKEGPHLKVSVLSGSNQHYWDINYKPGQHGTNRFQIAWACNFASSPCEGEGNEIVAYGQNPTHLRIDNNHKYNSPDASWWEIGT